MKKYFLLLVAFAFPGIAILAQDIEKGKKIPSTYDRSSITVFFMKFPGENHSSEVEAKIDKVTFTDKYYNNNLNNLVIEAPFSRGDVSVKAEKAIETYLLQQGVSKAIVNKWYNRKDDGSMDLDLIFDRGMFNATDAAYIKAQATKLGDNILKDYGNRLIEKSYILVLDYQNIQTMKEAKIEKTKGWKATVNGYLFKVKYDEEIQNALYDCWIYPEDSPEVRKEKIKKYEALHIPITFVTKTTVYAQASLPTEDTQLGKIIKQKTEDQLLQELVQKGYDESLYYLEMNNEEFMVKTTIHQVRPIRAKIGMKEGLKCDHRYFAYEYVYNEKTNSIEPRFRGVIRATSKIVDNRQVARGDMPTSQFYQTAGRKLREGYLIRQQNDLGGELLVGYEAGEVGGVYGRIDLRMGRYVGIRALFVYAELGIQVKDYDIGGILPYEGITFMHYGAGLAKGFMLTRNVEFRPYVGLGQEQANHNDFDNGTLKVLYLKAGANLALNLKHNVQLMGGVGSYSFIGNAENDNGDTGVKWDEAFPDRKGMATMFGIKFMF